MKTSEKEIHRILDANLNRAREGLRVVEDFARFVLDDQTLQKKTKSLRHKLASLFRSPPGKAGVAPPSSEEPPAIARGTLIDLGRDADRDVGKDFLTSAEWRRGGADDLVQANFARIEESLRVLEEFTKLLPSEISADLKTLRFEVYSLEKEYIAATCRASVARSLRGIGLYPIIDREAIGNLDPLEVARRILVPGVRIVQYRDKVSSTAEFCRVCAGLRRITSRKMVIFIVNDRVDVAVAVDADGVHLGQDDIPVSVARQLLGSRKVIGNSTHSFAQARRAAKEDVDYMSVGPIFSTPTKPSARPVGPELLAKVRKITNKPVIAIGGIDRRNLVEVLEKGADGVAAISAVLGARNIHSAAVSLANMCRRTLRSRR